MCACEGGPFNRHDTTWAGNKVCVESIQRQTERGCVGRWTGAIQPLRRRRPRVHAGQRADRAQLCGVPGTSRAQRGEAPRLDCRAATCSALIASRRRRRRITGSRFDAPCASSRCRTAVSSRRTTRTA
jgi:hypothetical protein